uniref:Bm1522 n=1 Tax=Brugia malayi TaxID=6279 RepID=A0A0H5SBZ6_BRUMA|nr:Bm1522 [Brugia malayi]
MNHSQKIDNSGENKRYLLIESIRKADENEERTLEKKEQKPLPREIAAVKESGQFDSSVARFLELTSLKTTTECNILSSYLATFSAFPTSFRYVLTNREALRNESYEVDELMMIMMMTMMVVIVVISSCKQRDKHQISHRNDMLSKELSWTKISTIRDFLPLICREEKREREREREGERGRLPWENYHHTITASSALTASSAHRHSTALPTPPPHHHQHSLSATSDDRSFKREKDQKRIACTVIDGIVGAMTSQYQTALPDDEIIINGTRLNWMGQDDTEINNH